MMRSMIAVFLGWLATLGVPSSAAHAQQRTDAFTLQQVVADSAGFFANAVLVIGPRNVIAWDAQYRLADARRLADAIQATGKHLQAIIVSHPDEDHYTGAATLVERFPGTPLYMTAAAVEKWKSFAPGRFKQDKPGTVPDSLVTPRVLPSNDITLDGVKLELIPDLSGDNPGLNSVLWIPSTRTLLTSDIVFNGVHPYLGAVDSASIAAWRASLDRLVALKPVRVIAGHKRDANAADTPDQLIWNRSYLAAFDSVRQRSASAPELRSAMVSRYPQLGWPALMAAGAMRAFRTVKAAPSASVQASQPLPTGKWTGRLSTPDGNTMDVIFDVAMPDERTIRLTLLMGPRSLQAADVSFDGRRLRFAVQAAVAITCELEQKDSPDLFAGQCKGADGGVGPIEMRAPTQKP